MNKVLQSLCILRPSLLQRPASPALYRPLHPTHFRPVASCRLISSNSDDRPGLEYEPIEDVEPLYRYQPGGYHPLAIGDQLHGGRYRIVHKLGHGGYSTAWLARDGQTQSLVAVKVSAAFSDHGEIETLSAINTNSGHSAGRSMVAPLLDSFDVQGPNGTHPCYVTTPAQSSLSDAREGTTTNMFPIDVARSLAAQVAIAIEYMHDQGFVHGGESSRESFFRDVANARSIQIFIWAIFFSSYRLGLISYPTKSCTKSTTPQNRSQLSH